MLNPRAQEQSSNEAEKATEMMKMTVADDDGGFVDDDIGGVHYWC